jgi:formate dehydrogenase subunit beta
MLVSRILEVADAGPVAALQTFLAGLMRATGSSRLLAPVVIADGTLRPEAISDQALMGRVNPLLPLMQADAVTALRAARANACAEPMVAVLRPCEVRASAELARQGKLDLGKTVLVGIDCLPTCELSYWEQGSDQHRDRPNWLVVEALQLAQAGEVQSDGTRLACQLCDRLAADYRAADVLIGLIGVQNLERLLILADEAKDARWNLEALTDRPATDRETVDREVTLWRLADRRKQAAAACLERLGLAEAHSSAIMGYLAKCTLCGECIDACPDRREGLRAAHARGREAFVQALLSAMRQPADCSVCGMCRVHCDEGIPLSAIQRALGLRAEHRARSSVGHEAANPRPWTT